MELIIHSPSEDGFLKEITFNNEDIKKELAFRLQKYQGLVYTEEEIKIAKTDRATLNKFKEAIENKRKEIKKQCLSPYEIFEIKIKEITALVDKPIAEIDKQVKVFEEKCKNEKKQDIEAIFNETVGDLKDVLRLKTLWNEKWLNATYKISTIAEEIIKAIEKVKSDFCIIEDLKSEFELQIKDKYLETLLLSEALLVKTRLEQQKIKLEEMKRQQEEKKTLEQARNELSRSIISSPVLTIYSKEDSRQQPERHLEMLEFKVWVTPEQKKALREFLLSIKIKVGKV